MSKIDRNMTQRNNESQLDAAWMASIVRDVIARLQTEPSQPEQSQPEHAEDLTDHRLVTVASIEQVIAAGKSEIRIGKRTVVTPAARDEAVRFGIALVAGSDKLKQAVSPTVAGLEISDSQNGGRDDLIAGQLARRNVIGSARIVVTDTPASDVYRLCCEKQRAVMVADTHSVDRFAAEFSPSVWVLDMMQLNLIAAVNVAQRILVRKATEKP
ncbi:hypothetical protein [Novipirellula artificiosorum]|uniref:Uncharacterized protein n=1 Tax=Novipirellula artificiosorum TaxID=2528016 RepID=A0A5C6DXD9_9BACT|nr:hypothetical protein [Novipirellula artificiosorum]TWU40884.1 hypothetical protein Poly41_17190 [Novipirellula artificiosorum]